MNTGNMREKQRKKEKKRRVRELTIYHTHVTRCSDTQVRYLPMEKCCIFVNAHRLNVRTEYDKKNYEG
jgi:hypothetical protein